MSAPQEVLPDTVATVSLPAAAWELVITAVARHYTYDQVKDIVPNLVAQVKRSAFNAQQAAGAVVTE